MQVRPLQEPTQFAFRKRVGVVDEPFSGSPVMLNLTVTVEPVKTAILEEACVERCVKVLTVNRWERTQ